ncbi:MAG: phenylalanine--tRNA ligase subunit beta, partial [Phycisphaerae bacterium]|nr:phenylalanine--tRNA ligase subunit beta [Phycisphaerae bacterium]
MKISLNWLTDYVDVSCSATELAAALMRIGLGCEEVTETASDVVLDLEITSNRPDCLGHLGVAREIAAMTGAAFRPPKIDKLPTSGKASELTRVEVLAPDLCPRYTARVIRGVKLGPSPSWMVERLAAVGLRSINNVVDVTNYVLMEYSQPLHSFDLDSLAERRIVVRRARDGEQLVSIDGTRCDLTLSMLVIADAERPVAVAGIMGGANTEVGTDTVNVLIESAQFDPLAVRRASRKLALMSESNYRFERGVDPMAVDTASLRACQLILQTAGGTLAEGVVDVWAKPFVSPQVSLRPERCDALLGIHIPPERQMEILTRLHL